MPADVFAALERALDPGAQRPRLAPDVELARFTSRWGGAHAVINNPRSHTYFRLSGAEADLVASLDGSRSVSELTVDGLSGDGLLTDTVAELADFLHQGGFLTDRWIDTYELIEARAAPRSARVVDRAWDRLRTLTVTFPGAPRFIDAVYRRLGRRLFTPVAITGMAVLIVAGAVAFGLASSSGDYVLLGRPTAGAAASLFGLGLAALFVHELGHALAIRRARRRILGAGMQLYLANPAFFIDSSDMVMADRKARAINAAAGPFAEAVAASLATVGAVLLGPSDEGLLLFRFAGITFVFMLINLTPFIELDGYWLMTDLLDTPDLRPRALSFLRSELPERIRTRRRLTRGEWGLTLFGVLGIVFTVAALVLAYTVWWPVLSAFVEGVWETGIVGRAILVLLGLLVLGPVVHGVGGIARGAAAWIARRGDALRFRAQRHWRMQAGEMVRALPQTGDLTDDQLNDVAGRVRRRPFGIGETIVRQGDAPDAFYVIRRGRCVVVERMTDGSESIIAALGPGATFGELALLEGMPRTATVRAETSGEAFAVDAATFQRVLAARLAPPELAPAAWPVTQVWSLAPFRNLDLVAVTELTAGGRWEHAEPGDEVVREGATGETFFVVDHGQLEVERNGTTVATLHAGDHFGELALLRDAPRNATVRAVTPARLFVVPRPVFDRLLRASFRSAGGPRRPSAHTAHSAHLARQP